MGQIQSEIRNGGRRTGLSGSYTLMEKVLTCAAEGPELSQGTLISVNKVLITPLLQ